MFAKFKQVMVARLGKGKNLLFALLTFEIFGADSTIFILKIEAMRLGMWPRVLPRGSLQMKGVPFPNKCIFCCLEIPAHEILIPLS